MVFPLDIYVSCQRLFDGSYFAFFEVQNALVRGASKAKIKGLACKDKGAVNKGVDFIQ